MGPKLIVALVAVSHDGHVIESALVRSTWPLVDGWFGFVKRSQAGARLD